jgi:hypothetical protein
MSTTRNVLTLVLAACFAGGLGTAAMAETA